MPHILDRFHRGASHAGAKSDGAGLGLAIVKMIAGLHGGKVSIASHPGSGSKLIPCIPSAEAEDRL